MRCLKCNRETEGNQVFCNECLAEMAKDPIKPGTPVNIPKRPPSVPRAPKTVQAKPEEQIAALEKRIRSLHRRVALLVVFLLILSGALAWTWFHTDSGFDIGQNYTPMTTAAPTEPN